MGELENIQITLGMVIGLVTIATIVYNVWFRPKIKKAFDQLEEQIKFRTDVLNRVSNITKDMDFIKSEVDRVRDYISADDDKLDRLIEKTIEEINKLKLELVEKNAEMHKEMANKFEKVSDRINQMEIKK